MTDTVHGGKKMLSNAEIFILDLARAINECQYQEKEIERLTNLIAHMVEPIYCKDCEYRKGDYCHHHKAGALFVYPEDYCSRGRRGQNADR